MKKILVAILVVVMAFSAVGCGSSGGSKKTNHVKLSTVEYNIEGTFSKTAKGKNYSVSYSDGDMSIVGEVDSDNNVISLKATFSSVDAKTLKDAKKMKSIMDKAYANAGSLPYGDLKTIMTYLDINDLCKPFDGIDIDGELAMLAGTPLKCNGWVITAKYSGNSLIVEIK